MIPTDAGSLLRMCAWCRRVRTSAGDWAAEEPVSSAQPITHGICPQCERQALEAAARARRGDARASTPAECAAQLVGE